MKYRIIRKDILPVLIGPTASGKTGIAVKLAEVLPLVVISADSRQIYRYLDIGTAKPTKEEIRRAPHKLIDFLEPDEEYSAGKFAEDANSEAIRIFADNKLPLVAGGAGLYLKALCEGFFKHPQYDEEKRKVIRDTLANQLKFEGIDFLYFRLSIIDPVSAEKYSDKNPKRIIRALEHYLLTGNTFSGDHLEFGSEPEFRCIYFYLDWPREKLYDRINKRSKIMWEQGLAEEMRKILKMNYNENLNSLNTVGYKEANMFINEKLSEAEAIDKIAQNTRHYAKRQITWFKKVENKIIIELPQKNPEKKILEYLSENGIIAEL